MKRKTENKDTTIKREGEKNHINVMKEVNHFDQHAIKIAPSVLESKLKNIWSPVMNFTRIGAFLTLAITLLITLLTADFKDIGFSGRTWEAFFLLLFVASLLAFATDGLVLIWNWKEGNLITVDKFVKDLIMEKEEKGGGKK